MGGKIESNLYKFHQTGPLVI